MTDTFNPRMLTLARDARGLSQAALAELADISQGYLSKAENGLLEASAEMVERLAKTLRFPREFFYLTDTFAGAGIGCHYRRRQSATVGTLRELQARMNVARIRFERLLQGVEIETPYEFARMDIDAYDESAEDIAALMRGMWKIPYGPIDNLTATIEAAGGLLVKEPFGTDKVDEMSQWLKGHRPFFFLNADTPGDRYRWSLAHGLGHVIMHTIPGTEREMEDQANRFAGEFLAPAADIGPELENLTMPKLAQLKMRWKMSMQAIVMRAYHLGIITERQRRSFFTRLGQAGYRKVEPYPLPPEEPTMLDRLIDFHRTKHGYTQDQVARTMVMPSAEFNHFYPVEPEDNKNRLRLVN